MLPQLLTLPDAIRIKEIAEETNNEFTLKDVKDIIQGRKLFIPNYKSYLTPYKQISFEISVLNKENLL